MSSPNASSSPMSIGWPGASPTSSSTSSRSGSFSSTTSSSSIWDEYSFVSTSNKPSLACAFPSWPSRSSLSPSLSVQRNTASNYNNFDVPNSYISDYDLFPEDLEDENAVPCLEEAPAPPRQVHAMPLLPLYAQGPRNGNKKRRSPRKQQKLSKMMTPIVESPLAAPE